MEWMFQEFSLLRQEERKVSTKINIWYINFCRFSALLKQKTRPTQPRSQKKVYQLSATLDDYKREYA